MEKEKEPGSARVGNFINYYSFNPPERRLQLIPKTLIHDYCISTGTTALDIGCNAGNLTLALYQHLAVQDDCPREIDDVDLNILGVDVDPTLIERSVQSNVCRNIVFRVADVLSKEDQSTVIGSYLVEKGKDRFDIVFSFSVTMWIHLNHGDEGLKSFLRYVASISNVLLIEPQPWHCYLTAARRMRKLGCAPFDKLPQLEWRENVVHEIVSYLESDQCSMEHLRNLGRTESWERPLCLFRSAKAR